MSVAVNKRQIAKNAFFLYVRTFFVIVLMLFTSRILLKGLGTKDFGLYNLVGSIVAMFTSLRVVFASATQRFLNYEKTSKNIQTLRNIFVISKRLHWGLSIIFLITTESLGIWALYSYLNIPIDRIEEAFIALQCSIFSAVAMLTTVPYDAIIISNERFNAYAYLSILECILHLAAAYIIIIIPGDKLIWYSIIVLAISVLVRLINLVYCHYSFIECRGKGYFDKELFIRMSKFAGWNFLGNFALSIYNEGINMVLNIFGGVIANAARAISVQVSKGIGAVSDKMTTAFAPQATQQYSIGEYNKFYDLIFLSAKLINYLYILMAVPIAIYTPHILNIWLGEIPENSVSFVRAILIYGLARSIHSPLDLCFKCYGQLKHYQIIEICCLLPALPLAYLFLKIGLPLYWAIIAMAITNFVNNIAITILAQRQWGFHFKDYISIVIIPTIMVLLTFTILSTPIILTIDSIIFQAILTTMLLILTIIYMGMSRKERQKILTTLNIK